MVFKNQSGCYGLGCVGQRFLDNITISQILTHPAVSFLITVNVRRNVSAILFLPLDRLDGEPCFGQSAPCVAR
jgi:hypothetical protein